MELVTETLAADRIRARSASTWLGAGLAVLTVGWSAQEFTPLLLLYRAQLGLSSTVVQAAFALYALGLVPGLLLGGPVSDRIGRRKVMLPTLLVSAAGSALLMAGGTGVPWLFIGRLVVGIACGAAFSSGAAWIKELSEQESGNPGPRRLTVAMTAGFGGGPIIAGVLAQWAPWPTVLPYLPHLVLVACALPLAARTPETTGKASGSRARPRFRGRFLLVVAPLAPWVFATASIGLSYLPGLVGKQLGAHALIFSAVVPMLVAAAGIAVQPLARRLDHPQRPRLLTVALGIVFAGLLVAIAAAAEGSPLLVALAALVLGAAYGTCQVCGLLEVQRIAPPEHLASMTAMYQALTYLGFIVPFPLAALGQLASPSVLLIAVAVLAVLTLVWVLPASRRKVRR
ncbi:MFS transporter [Sciscionella sediminilitoris]|uniref:MFS transporter n=1 Tax=Sciscionella sediminilitoris TaxID=1445613 RepID=UPI0004DF8744|nr:MFS transporter [Sciscionella sp. SE31]